MGVRGQAEILPFIGTVIGLFLFITLVFYPLITAFNQQSCASYIAERDSCRNSNSQLETNIALLEKNLNLSEERYINLTTTNVTKKDIEDILYEINRTRSEVNYVKNEFVNVNNNLVASFNSLIINQRTSIIINFFFIGLFLLDFALLSFDIDVKKLIVWGLKHWWGKLKTKFKKKEPAVKQDDKKEVL